MGGDNENGFKPTDLFPVAKGFEDKFDGDICPENWVDELVAKIPKEVEDLLLPILTASQETELTQGALSAIYALHANDKFSDEELIWGIIGMVGNYKLRIQQALQKGDLSSIFGHLASLEETNPESFRWLLEKYPLLWIQLLVPEGETLFGVSRTDYNEIYAQGLYQFTRRPAINEFAKSLARRVTDPSIFGQNGLEDKRVLTLGGGLGRDEAHFVNKGAFVHSVDSSAIARKHQKENLTLRQNISDSPNPERGAGFYLEEGTTRMIDFMRKSSLEIEQGEKKPFDVIYSHSVFHLDSHSDFVTALALAEGILSPGGIIAISLRMPDKAGMQGVNFGTGVLLSAFQGVRRTMTLTQKGAEVYSRESDTGLAITYSTFLSPDGVVRRYGDSEIFTDALKTLGLDIISTEMKTMTNYGIAGSAQQVLYLKAQKSR